MTFTISADDPRTIRAIEIAAEADYWLSGRDHDGQTIFAVPSQGAPGQYHIVTSSSCDCPDFVRGVETNRDHACKHVLAVRLHCELVRAQQVPDRRRGHLSVLRPRD